MEEIINFVKCIFDNDFVTDEKYFIEKYFSSIDNISLYSIKIYYLELLQNIEPDNWEKIYTFLKFNQEMKYSKPSENNTMRKINSVHGTKDTGLIIGKTHIINGVSKNLLDEPFKLTKTISLNNTGSTLVKTVEPMGILLTTKDASTLTDGPTIYLVEDVEKIGKYLIQQTKIPKELFVNIMKKISFNNQLQKKIAVMDKNLEDIIGKDAEKEKKVEKQNFNPEVKRLTELINQSREQIQLISLDNCYIPNTYSHQQIWCNKIVDNAYIPIIDETIVKEIMVLDVADDMKLLLMLGIGSFITTDTTYMEIMKKLAYEQKLYLIIASSDFIYGTNYQFCHGFIGKDLLNMSFQKTLQAMGRIGRGNVQKTYSIRFRDNELFNKIFLPNENDNIEARKFNELFCS